METIKKNKKTIIIAGVIEVFNNVEELKIRQQLYYL